MPTASQRCRAACRSGAKRRAASAQPPPTKCTISMRSPASTNVPDHWPRRTSSRLRSTATASSSSRSSRIISRTETRAGSRWGSPLRRISTELPSAHVTPAQGTWALYPSPVRRPESPRGGSGPRAGENDRGSRPVNFGPEGATMDSLRAVGSSWPLGIGSRPLHGSGTPRSQSSAQPAHPTSQPFVSMRSKSSGRRSAEPGG